MFVKNLAILKLRITIFETIFIVSNNKQLYQTINYSDILLFAIITSN